MGKNAYALLITVGFRYQSQKKYHNFVDILIKWWINKILYLAKPEDLSKLRDEYIKKSVLTNRIFMLLLGLSILLLLFIILPYYLSLEHLNILEDKKDQFQKDFTRFSSFNSSLVNYYQNYIAIFMENLIRNQMTNLSKII